MKTGAAIVLIALFAVNAAQAEPPKKGRVMCEGDACREVNVPTGSMLGGAWDAIVDLKGRVARRIETNEPGEAKTVQPKAPKVSAVKKQKKREQVHISQTAPLAGDTGGNLPAYYEGLDRHDIEANEKVVFVPKSHDPKLKGLKPGDVVWAVVEQEITASPEMPTPIRAIATTGKFKGAYFVGEATLERELKRVCFNFTKIRPKDGDTVYSVKAAGLSPSGSVCLEGEYVSQTGKFFIAELASAAAAGFVDSTINRNQTALGTYVQEPSLANSGKNAAVQALSKTTDRMAEQVRSAPEYTHIRGYQEIQVMIQDDPVESGT